MIVLFITDAMNCLELKEADNVKLRTRCEWQEGHRGVRLGVRSSQKVPTPSPWFSILKGRKTENQRLNFGG